MASHVAIGVFDGVHAGHRAVLASATAAARTEGGAVVALTFDPHPSRLLRPEAPTQLILSASDKDQRLREAGAQRIVYQPFDHAHRAIEAENYLAWLQAEFPDCRSIHIGENFRFGHQRRGEPTLLAAQGKPKGISVTAVPAVQVHGEPASSSRIRAALREGNLDLANEMLVHPYEASGKIQPGRQLGQTLGFPTLNLAWAPELLPAFGVYVAEVLTQNGTAEPAIINWGVRPTVEATPVAAQLEAHLLRPSSTPPTHGDFIKVRWLSRLRGEQRFADLAALKAQIKEDCARARHWLGLSD